MEVALKMALGTFRNEGKPRRRIVVMEGSYHGDTIGAMSVGARGVFNEAYEPLLFEVDRIPFPAPGRERDTLDALEALTREGHAAALIVEPLVLGAGGLFYAAKDSVLDSEQFARAYGGRLEQFRAIKRTLDPAGMFQSDLTRRLAIG